MPSAIPLSTGRRRLYGLAVACFGALAVCAAFPTIGVWPFALVAFAPALVFSRQLSWRQRFRLGWLLGLGYQLILFHWIVFTMREMTGLPSVAGVGMLILYAAWHGLQVGIFMALADPARRAAEARLRWAGPLAIAAIWVGVEWLFPMLFPWSLGHAAWEVRPVASLMAITGVTGPAFVVVLVNAGLADLWADRSAARLWPSLAALLVLVGAGVGWSIHLDGAAVERTLRVAVIQPNYALEEKKHATLKQRQRFLERIETLLADLPADRYDLIVSSEGSYPFYWRLDADGFEGTGSDNLPFMVEATRRVQRAVAEGPATHVIIGGLRRGDDGRTRNAAVHIGPDGTIRGHYDKKTLVPFSEYIPLFPELADSIPGISNFKPGNDPCVFSVGELSVSCGICYETMFAGDTRDDAGSAALLVNLTIDTWFGETTAPWFHLMTHASRAVELGVPLLRTALTGISAVVGVDGQVIALLPLGAEGVLSVDVALYDVDTPYREFGPIFAYICVLAMLALLIDAFRRRRKLFGPAGVSLPVRPEGEPGERDAIPS